MGALTIKNYSYESRPWELSRICVPNLLTSYPNYLLLHFKNKSLLKILSWNRNEFISNELRFSLDFFSNILNFTQKQSFKENLLNTLISYIIMLKYIRNLCSITVKTITSAKNYIFNLCSNVFVIHNYLNTKVFNLKLKKSKLLQSSNFQFFNFAHFGFLKNFNDCLNDCFLHICIDKNSMIKFTDFYYYLYNNNLLLSNTNISDDNEIIDEQSFNSYNKFSILNLLIDHYNNVNIKFFYRLTLKRIFKKFIMDFSMLGITLKDILLKYFPYDMAYKSNDFYQSYLSCVFSSFSYVNSTGFVIIEDLKNLKLINKTDEIITK